MLLGLVSGGLIGLYFHQESFAGGYASFRRRMMRLGHIAFFGLGIINVVFSLTLEMATISIDYPTIASLSLIGGAFLMPLICFLTAWKKPFRHFFALPVAGVGVALILLLKGMVTS